MDIKQFYTMLLKVCEPWYVDRVEIQQEVNRVDVWIDHRAPVRVACPECGTFYTIYDHAPERVYQHLDTCQMLTYIHVRLPRVKCPTHGVRQILSELGEGRAPMTYALEERLLLVLQECSVKTATQLLHLTWDQGMDGAIRGVERGISRKPVRLPRHLAVDEKAFRGKEFETLVCDQRRGVVDYVTEDNTQESLERYFRQFDEAELAQIVSITTDMWDPYIAAIRACIPEYMQKLVFDRFHVMQQLTKAVDTVRKQEHAALSEAGSELLKGTKFLWLYNHENVPPSRRRDFHMLRTHELKTALAWAIKENLRHLWDYENETWARKFFKGWYFWASHSRLKPMKKAAKTLKDHFENIVTYVQHRLTNAVAEGLNSKIEKMKRLACGFRNRAHYRTMIYFHCGGLDMAPRPPLSPTIKWILP